MPISNHQHSSEEFFGFWKLNASPWYKFFCVKCWIPTAKELFSWYHEKENENNESIKRRMNIMLISNRVLGDSYNNYKQSIENFFLTFNLSKKEVKNFVRNSLIAMSIWDYPVIFLIDSNLKTVFLIFLFWNTLWYDRRKLGKYDIRIYFITLNFLAMTTRLVCSFHQTFTLSLFTKLTFFPFAKLFNGANHTLLKMCWPWVKQLDLFSSNKLLVSPSKWIMGAPFRHISSQYQYPARMLFFLFNKVFSQ